MRRPEVQPRAAGKRRRIVYAILLAGVTAALAPTILAATGLHNQVLRGVIPAEAGTLTARTASFGWFSPTELGGVRAFLPDGDVLLEAESLTLDRTVIDLLRDRSDLGTVRLKRPELRVTATETGSDMEDFVAHLLAAQDESDASISCTVAVEGGKVVAADKLLGQKSTITIEDFACQLVHGGLASLRAAATTLSPTEKSGKLTLSLVSTGGPARQLDLTARRWPVATMSFGLRRVLTNARATGLLTLDATTTWSTAADVESSGTATVTSLELDAAPLGTDQLRLAEVRVPWKVQMDGDRLLVEEFSVASDVGQITARGELSRELVTREAVDVASAEVLRLPFAASGSIDLARLAAMLPGTLRIKEGVAVSSGRAEFSLESRPAEPAHLWNGSLAVSELSAQDRDRVLEWEQPVVVAASIRHDGQWAVESLTCRSEFLQVAASGSREQMDAEIDFDLSRLTADLGQFLDVADWQLGGRGSVRAEWRRVEGGLLRTSVGGSVNALRFVDAAGRLWQEPSVQLNAKGVLSLPEGERTLTWERGSQLTLSTVKDRAVVKLDGPLSWPAGGGTHIGPCEVQAEGELAGWFDRLSPWMDLEPWRVGGSAKITARVEVDADGVSASALQLVLTELQAVGPGWRVHEPQVTLATSGRYDVAHSSLKLGETTLVGSSASLRARNTEISWSDAGGLPQVRGEAVFLSYLARIDAWRIGTDGRPLPLRPAGMAKGTVRLEGQARELRGELSATLTDFAVYEHVAALGGRQSGYRPAWQEAQVELAASGAYRQRDDGLDIQQAAVRSRSLAAAVVGSVADVTGRCEANIRGTIEYDLADVGPLLAAHLGTDMAITGREQATFELIGPLRPSDGTAARMVNTAGNAAVGHWSERLRGHVAAGWESIQLFGLPIGRGRLDGQLYDGKMTFAPVDVPVGPQARLTTSAVAHLTPPPGQLAIPSGTVVKNVEITPEVSGRMLKYFVPSLADAIETQGTFSLATSGGSVPLEKPLAAEAAGILTIHAAQVRPGRVGRDWILLAEQIEALLKSRDVPQLSSRPQRDLMAFDEQAVHYRITGGRVYHENLVFRVGDVVVRSQGSVGFDQSLAILVEVPVKDAWIEGKPQLARFRGQTIRGTVRGTFDKIDYGTLVSDLAQQIGQGLLEGAVEHELNRALDKLLRPR